MYAWFQLELCNALVSGNSSHSCHSKLLYKCLGHFILQEQTVNSTVQNDLRYGSYCAHYMTKLMLVAVLVTVREPVIKTQCTYNY